MRETQRIAILSLLVATAVACVADDQRSAQRSAATVAPSCSPLGGQVSGVQFSDDQASFAIHFVDNASVDELQAIDGVGPSIAARIIGARPFATAADPLAALDAVPYVGARVLGGLRAHGDTGAVLDWANHASADQLAAVCRIGSKTAGAIIDARPFSSLAELQGVRNIGPTTIEYLLGTSGYSCSTKGSVLQEWCGVDGAQCWCGAGSAPSGYVLDEDAATGWAEEAAGVFYFDNADYAWEEYCESAYDHNLGYDQVDVQNFCDRFVQERFYIAAINAGLDLAGTSYADEDSARQAIIDMVEPLFLAQAPGWMLDFEAALIAFLGAP